MKIWGLTQTFLVVISAQSSDVIKQAYEGKLNRGSKQIFSWSTTSVLFKSTPPQINVLSSLRNLVGGDFRFGLVTPDFEKKMLPKKPVPVFFKISIIYNRK